LKKENNIFILNKYDGKKIINQIDNNTPIVICRNFLSKTDCNQIINLCDSNATLEMNRKKKLNKFLNFYSIDVLPQKVKTSRVFRTFELSEFALNKFLKTKIKILQLQKKILKLKKNKIFRKFQVIHYPKGGGFFDWHNHPRYPTNYGMIITLSEKGKNFKEGVTNFKIKNKILNLEKFNISAGDLILFRFDLSHSISKVDPKENLLFDKNGRWTLVVPVYHDKF